MSLLSWFGLKTPAPSAPQNTWSLTNTEFFAYPTSSGETVTERSAMQMTAVYACVRYPVWGAAVIIGSNPEEEPR